MVSATLVLPLNVEKSGFYPLKNHLAYNKRVLSAGPLIEVKGISIEKDIENIQQLAKIIQEEHDRRTEHINPNRSDKREANAEWKSPSERLVKASDYIKRLFHDLDVAVNKDGKGDLFGVAYQAAGQKTGELESFLQQNQ